MTSFLLLPLMTVINFSNLKIFFFCVLRVSVKEKKRWIIHASIFFRLLSHTCDFYFFSWNGNHPRRQKFSIAARWRIAESPECTWEAFAILVEGKGIIHAIITSITNVELENGILNFNLWWRGFEELRTQFKHFICCRKHTIPCYLCCPRWRNSFIIVCRKMRNFIIDYYASHVK